MPSHPVFWLLEQVSYKKDICCLEVKVVDFFLRDVISFSNQKPKAPIHSITFLNLPNDEDLRMALRYYSHRMNDLDKAMEAGYNEFKGIDDRSEKRVAKKNLLFRSYEETSRLEVSFDVWFKETQFKLGYIAFDNDIKELKQIF
jgi:hypothetical protein